MFLCLNTREKEALKMRKSEQTSPVSFHPESLKIIDQFTTEILNQMSVTSCGMKKVTLS